MTIEACLRLEAKPPSEQASEQAVLVDGLTEIIPWNVSGLASEPQRHFERVAFSLARPGPGDVNWLVRYNAH